MRVWTFRLETDVAFRLIRDKQRRPWRIVKPRAEDPQAELIRRKGEEHKTAYLDHLLAEGRDVATIEIADRDEDWATSRQALRGSGSGCR